MVVHSYHLTTTHHSDHRLYTNNSSPKRHRTKPQPEPTQFMDPKPSHYFVLDVHIRLVLQQQWDHGFAVLHHSKVQG